MPACCRSQPERLVISRVRMQRNATVSGNVALAYSVAPNIDKSNLTGRGSKNYLIHLLRIAAFPRYRAELAR
jgi:hypothetical protein